MRPPICTVCGAVLAPDGHCSNPVHAQRRPAALTRTACEGIVGVVVTAFAWAFAPGPWPVVTWIATAALLTTVWGIRFVGDVLGGDWEDDLGGDPQPSHVRLVHDTPGDRGAA